MERLVAMGRLGLKSGAGFSKYDENRKPVPDPEVAALIELCANQAGIRRREHFERRNRRPLHPGDGQRRRAGCG